VKTFAVEYKGRVVRVISGDTLVLFQDNNQIKIRLAGVSAPKISQPFFNQSKQSLEELVFNKEITVIQEKISKDKIVGKVYLGEPQLDIRCVMAPCYVENHINAEQIRRGMAWLNGKDRKYSEDADLAELQEEAKQEKRGLWQDPHPTAPWKWQASKK
jgi:endonuclease YncB( thermonuclease family)